MALNNLAFAKAQDGVDLDQALTMSQKARQQMPNSPAVSDTLGWIYVKKNLSDDAVRIFKDLVAQVPDNPTFHYHYGVGTDAEGRQAVSEKRAHEGVGATSRLDEGKGADQSSCCRKLNRGDRAETIPIVSLRRTICGVHGAAGAAVRAGLLRAASVGSGRSDPARYGDDGRTVVLSARPVIDLRVRHLGGDTRRSVSLVFAVWIAPDLLIPGLSAFLAVRERADAQGGDLAIERWARLSWPALALRTIRAVVIVPIVEELFWRAWLMRWIIDPDFESVPLGEYSALAFWVVAVMFASEHGPYWDVGLAAGIIYNWWMVRTQESGRPDSGACGDKFCPERVRDRVREVGILVMTIEQVRPGRVGCRQPKWRFSISTARCRWCAPDGWT